MITPWSMQCTTNYIISNLKIGQDRVTSWRLDTKNTHCRSQIMHVPSELALMHSWSFMRTLMQDTEPLCSFMASTSLYCVSEISCHTRTCPSPPPLIIRLQSDVVAMAVTPLLWASLIIICSLPDCGRKILIFPSSHAENKPVILDIDSLYSQVDSIQCKVAMGSITEGKQFHYIPIKIMLYLFCTPHAYIFIIGLVKNCQIYKYKNNVRSVKSKPWFLEWVKHKVTTY